MLLMNFFESSQFSKKRKTPINKRMQHYFRGGGGMENMSYSYKWIYEISYIWTAENDMKIRLIIAVADTT